MSASRIQPKRAASTQTGTSLATDQETQTENWPGTYTRESRCSITTYESLICNYLSSREGTLNWLKDEQLIASSQSCTVCKRPMVWTSCQDRLDGYRWECRATTDGKRHKSVKSIRHGSWFAQSNLSISEVLKFTYWWCFGLNQNQIRAQLSLSPNTVVDWDMFCRETCSVVIYDERQMLGGEGKIVEIDESKVGKRKYHRGHYVEGQWVFGGIEQGSRKSFIVCVPDRKEETLVAEIKKWIHPGTTIYSDCWKGYINLSRHGYFHDTVNHSVEYVTSEGVHINKIEGHWRQLKCSLPSHGRKTAHYDSYIAEFLWRYIHRDEDLFLVFLNDIKKVYNPSRCE